MELKQFEDMFNKVVEDILNHQSVNNIPMARDRLEKLLKLNFAKCAKLRGYVVVCAFKAFCSQEPTEEEVARACNLGWIFQIIQGLVIAIDDFLDGSALRYGKPTWNALQGERTLVMVDLQLLEKVVLLYAEGQFGCQDFKKMREYLSKILLDFQLGQVFEESLQIENNPTGEKFSFENYQHLSSLLLLHSGFVGPLKVGAMLAGKEDEATSSQILLICEKLALYWAIRDDLEDISGTEMDGPQDYKDIKQGKCKWPIIKAKELATPEKWSLLLKEYGKDNQNSVAVVRATFEDLNIPALGSAKLLELSREIEDDLKVLKGVPIASVIEDLFTGYVKPETKDSAQGI